MRKLILSAIALGFLTIACKKEETTKSTPTTPTQTIGDFIKSPASWRIDSVYIVNTASGYKNHVQLQACAYDDKYEFKNNKGLIHQMTLKCDEEEQDTTGFLYNLFSNNDSILIDYYGLFSHTGKIQKIDNHRFSTQMHVSNGVSELTIYKKY